MRTEMRDELVGDDVWVGWLGWSAKRISNGVELRTAACGRLVGRVLEGRLVDGGVDGNGGMLETPGKLAGWMRMSDCLGV